MNKTTKLINHFKIILIVLIIILTFMSITKSIIRIKANSNTQNTICVPIIMYHQVKTNGYGKDVISPYEFECDLKYLAENHYNTITMTQLIDYVYDNKELPENPIILTFDDGYLTTYKYVYPLLKEYNMKIVLSVIGKGIDNFTKVKDEHINYAHSTWNQISEMSNSGLVEIQNHTYNLHKTGNGRIGCCQKKNESLEAYEELLTEDTLTLQEKVKDMVGNTPNTYTYPYGEYSDSTNDILRKLGFRATLSCKFGVNIISNNTEKLYGLKRICRSHNQNVKRMIKEGMETLKYIKE